MNRNPRSEAREFAVQFLYQSESEKLYHFSESHFLSFVQHFTVPKKVVEPLRGLVQGTLERVSEIDLKIEAVAANWSLSRMSVVDRNVLRLATFELLSESAPHKVVLNEAIELAKKFGSADSGKFVNGILDRLSRSMKNLS